ALEAPTRVFVRGHESLLPICSRTGGRTIRPTGAHPGVSDASTACRDQQGAEAAARSLGIDRWQSQRALSVSILRINTFTSGLPCRSAPAMTLCAEFTGESN